MLFLIATLKEIFKEIDNFIASFKKQRNKRGDKKAVALLYIGSHGGKGKYKGVSSFSFHMYNTCINTNVIHSQN